MSSGKGKSESMYTPDHLEDKCMPVAKQYGEEERKGFLCETNLPKKTLSKINIGPCKTHKNF